MKLIKGAYAEDFKKIYSKISIYVKNNNICKLKEILNEFLDKLKENFDYKIDVRIIFCNSKVKNIFGKVQGDNYNIIELYLNNIINNKNKYELDEYIYGTIVNTLVHEYIHCIQIFKINNNIVDETNLFQFIEYNLDKTKINYEDSPLEVEAHKISNLFMKELALITNLYSLISRSDFFLANMFFYYCNDLNYYKSHNTNIHMYDYLLQEVYKSNNKILKSLNIFSMLSFSNHEDNIIKLLTFYINSKSMRFKLIKIYKFILIHEINYIQIEKLLLLFEKYINNKIIYELLSSIYDQIIRENNVLFIKYEVLRYIYIKSYNRFSLYINSKDLLERYECSCEYYLEIYERIGKIIKLI